MEQYLETEVRPARNVVLQNNFIHPWSAINHAVIAGVQLSYSRGCVLSRIAGDSGFQPKASGWGKYSTDKNKWGEMMSLVPCMTALAIEWVKMGGRSGSGKRSVAKGGAE